MMYGYTIQKTSRAKTRQELQKYLSKIPEKYQNATMLLDIWYLFSILDNCASAFCTEPHVTRSTYPLSSLVASTSLICTSDSRRFEVFLTFFVFLTSVIVCIISTSAILCRTQNSMPPKNLQKLNSKKSPIKRNVHSSDRLNFPYTNNKKETKR